MQPMGRGTKLSQSRSTRSQSFYFRCTFAPVLRSPALPLRLPGPRQWRGRRKDEEMGLRTAEEERELERERERERESERASEVRLQTSAFREGSPFPFSFAHLAVAVAALFLEICTAYSPLHPRGRSSLWYFRSVATRKSQLAIAAGKDGRLPAKKWRHSHFPVPTNSCSPSPTSTTTLSAYGSPMVFWHTAALA